MVKLCFALLSQIFSRHSISQILHFLHSTYFRALSAPNFPNSNSSELLNFVYYDEISQNYFLRCKYFVPLGPTFPNSKEKHDYCVLHFLFFNSIFNMLRHSISQTFHFLHSTYFRAFSAPNFPSSIALLCIIPPF